MFISICTPTNNVRHLRRAYESLAGQLGDVRWEWVLGVNGGVTPQDARAALGPDGGVDERVRVVVVEGPGIGKLKRDTFAYVGGDVLLELDHDDELTPSALLTVARAFEKRPEVGFVYSDCVDVSDTSEPCTYHDPARRRSWESNGWQFYSIAKFDGYERVLVPHTFTASPQSLLTIHWAPNHLRAWRRDVYEKVGGHDPTLEVLDDHDLLCRTFIETPMFHISDPLYRYHVHGQNTWLSKVGDITGKTRAIGRKYLRQMVAADVKRHGLPLLDLGGAHNCPSGWTSVDLPGQGASIEADLSHQWPFEDNSVGAFRASDFLEHLPDQIHTMREIHRCLVPGGWLLSDTPSTDGRGAWQDPTHCSFWNENSWWYWTRKSHVKYLRSRGITGPLFAEAHVETYYPTPWHDEHEIPYVRADVWADKPGRAFPRSPGR